METSVSFMSDEFKLAGIVHIPADLAPGDKRAAFLVLHGFGTGKDGSTPEILANMFCDWGYVALRFDMRSCGDSDGEKGLLRCLDQVADTQNAVSWLAEQDGVDPARIGVIGHSFGAAVAVYAGGVDKRIAAVISSCGWGDGESKFKLQHPGAAWPQFTEALAEGRRRRKAGEPDLKMARWDIVPIPEHLRGNMGENVTMEFASETAQSMYDFRANDVVGNIAPRPLLLFHASDDSVTPTDQSLQLFAHAGQPTDLLLLSGVDHFPFSIGDDRSRDALRDWLGTYFPA
jgi:pimeloyl-ACP methyl ester carboxylesterase